MTKKQIQIMEQVFAWYTANKRHLPWRKTRNPYRILVSEVMLQQTQVDRVIPKYATFLRLYPSVQKLAAAKQSDVITIWKGLGYNRRALYLHGAAQRVVTQYNGRFPKDLLLLKELPGVGDYTARALLCFAFGLPVAMIDTNHRKFYEHVLFKKKFKNDAALLQQADSVISYLKQKDGLDKNMVYHWNQAIMDYMSAHPLPKQKNKTTQVTFRDSDRWYRGQIIDVIRDKKTVSYSFLHKSFADIDAHRLERIVLGLKKDGLIVLTKKGIVFP